MLVCMVSFPAGASPTVLQLVQLPAKVVCLVAGQSQPWAKINAGGFFAQMLM